MQFMFYQIEGKINQSIGKSIFINWFSLTLIGHLKPNKD